MRSHLDASRSLSVNIGGAIVPRLILGHMPFVGESYQGVERSEEYRRRFSQVENTVALLRSAVEEHGITAAAVMPSDDQLSILFLNALKTTMKLTGLEIGLIPCFKIPLTIDHRPVDDYRRWVTYYHTEKEMMSQEKLLDKYVSDPILLCREGWREKFPDAISHLKPYSAQEIKRLQINYEELEAAMMRLEGFCIILAEPGSESDFLAITRRTDLLKEMAERLRDRFACPIVVGVHHAGSTISVLEESEVVFDGYVTPVNKLGALMLPSFKLAQHAIKCSKKPIIAIKTLAGGRITPDEAFQYVFREMHVKACMVGAASEKELSQDFSIARKFLEERI